VIAAEKRRANGWQAMGSYTFSRTYGLQVSSGVSASDAQVSTIAPQFPTTAFGRDPNNLTNAYGRPPNDRPHMFRTMGAIDVPRTGLTVAAMFQYFSGAVDGDGEAEPAARRSAHPARAARRAPALVAVAARPARVEDVALNPRRQHRAAPRRVQRAQDRAEEALASDDISAANFGQSTAFVDPRRAMIGVRFKFR